MAGFGAISCTKVWGQWEEGLGLEPGSSPSSTPQSSNSKDTSIRPVQPSPARTGRSEPRPRLSAPPSFCAYDWGARLAYLDPKAQDKFLAYLEKSQIGAEALLLMGRSAKARGNRSLGHKLLMLFQNRINNTQNRPNLLLLPYLDPDGDPIYLARSTPSEQAWRGALRLLSDPKERQVFATVLGLYLSLELPSQTPAETLRQVMSQTQRFLDLGLPLPPRLRFFRPVPQGPDQTPGGSYRVETDTLSLPTDASPSAWAHEWAHFLLDLADDREGPNRTFFVAKDPAGHPLFDAQRCSTWESLSIYGGRCDSERAGNFLAGTKKAEEDPAETLASILEGWRGEVLPNTLHLNLLESYFLDRLRPATFWAEDPQAQPGFEEARSLDREVQAFHRELGRDTPAPPRYEPGRDPPQYVRELADWLRGLETEVLPRAKALRRRKQEWAEAWLRALAHPASAEPETPPQAPWEVLKKIPVPALPD